MPEYFIGEGTLINATLVFIGGVLGAFLKDYIPQSLKESTIKAFGLFSFGMAFHLFQEGEKANLIIVLVCLLIGGAIGYLFDFENTLDKLFSKAFKGFGTPEGFNTATIMFCVGPITILGCILEGTKGDNSIILSKAFMDGVSSILLGASLGYSVSFSSFSILVYQGILTYGAFFLKSYINNASLSTVAFVGATLITGLGLKLLGLTKDLKLLNFILSPILGLFIKS